MNGATAQGLAFVVNVPSFFVSHRLDIGLAAKARGWPVSVIAGREATAEPARQSQAVLRSHGIALREAPFSASGTNPFAELRGLWSVLAHVRALKPDIVHTASPKGNLYGGIAARLCRVPKLVVAVSGQGFLFTGQGKGLKRLLASLYLALIRWVYAHPDCTVIVQNRDDWNGLLAAGLLRAEQLVLIPGSGVDLARYADIHESDAEAIVLLPARLLTDKGVCEFVEAARRLRAEGCGWRFVLAGAADAANPAAIASAQVRAWVAEGAVEWLGHCDDMPATFRHAGIVCLPSHREGMPKALLEAAAAGKPVVTCDAVGCREAVIPGETGLLVPVGDATALAAALRTLIDDAGLRTRFGRRARQWAAERFSVGSVVAQVLAIYDGRHVSRADAPEN